MSISTALIIYFILTPLLFFLASKVDNKLIYRLLLIIITILSLIPISIGIYLIRNMLMDEEWTVWSYVSGSAGLFSLLFGIAVALPVYWMYRSK